jgi:hypothetical protein
MKRERSSVRDPDPEHGRRGSRRRAVDGLTGRKSRRDAPSEQVSQIAILSTKLLWITVPAHPHPYFRIGVDSLRYWHTFRQMARPIPPR